MLNKSVLLFKESSLSRWVKERELGLRQSAAVLLHIYSLTPEQRASLHELNVYLHECFILNYRAIYRDISGLHFFKDRVKELGESIPMGQRKIDFICAKQRFFMPAKAETELTVIEPGLKA